MVGSPGSWISHRVVGRMIPGATAAVSSHPSHQALTFHNRSQVRGRGGRVDGRDLPSRGPHGAAAPDLRALVGPTCRSRGYTTAIAEIRRRHPHGSHGSHGLHGTGSGGIVLGTSQGCGLCHRTCLSLLVGICDSSSVATHSKLDGSGACDLDPSKNGAGNCHQNLGGCEACSNHGLACNRGHIHHVINIV